MTDFAAIDVETANANFASICQVGIVQFKDGAATDEWQSFVNPETYFDPVNISIHGITAGDVQSAPTWPQLQAHVNARLQGRIAVSHTAFDRVSLSQACGRYALPTPTLTWLDSARVARRAWPDFCGRSGYGLRRVAEMLALSFTAHVAVEDARVAGQIIKSACDATNLTLDDWFARVNRPIFDTAPTEVNREGPLAGNVLVFTGTLSMVRGKAAAMAAHAGCEVHDSVTRETTLLVVGDQDISKLAGHDKSSKHRKAETLIHAGQPIRIIGESDFLLLLGTYATG